MTWRVQSVSEGPVCLSDIGINFRKGDIRDLDLIGRENAEASNDIRLALQKGWIVELEKGPAAPRAGTNAAIDPSVVAKLSAAVQQVDDASKAMQEQKDAIARLEKSQEHLRNELKNEREKSKKESEKSVTDALQAYFEKDPLGLRVLKEALQNIQVERGSIRQEKEALVSSGDSEAEIKAKERILKIRDEKLEKNAEQIGKSISAEADDIDELLGDMDSIGM